jgi:short-subunit dehydrogenase
MKPCAVVTGASRGLGAAYAHELAGRGWNLFLVSRDGARLEGLASDLKSRYAAGVGTAVLDLSQPDAAHRLYAAAREHGQPVDLLINNAGFGMYGEFLEMSMPRLQEMLRLHINTVVESCRLFLPAMVERGGGGIINVSSLAGFFPLPYLAEYAATKSFLINFSEAMAAEMRRYGVRIQACCPGKTATDFHLTAGHETRNLLGTRTPGEVVRRSLDALERGPVVVVIGWQARMFVPLSRLLPRSLLHWAATRWMQPARTVSGMSKSGQREHG